MTKEKKNIKVRDLKPSKDAKGGFRRQQSHEEQNRRQQDHRGQHHGGRRER
jgi:hypothetical protein